MSVAALADAYRTDEALRADVGTDMHLLVTRLFPICRSITGDGVRQTLSVVGELLPLDVHEVPSGTPVFDWEVPPEWNVRDAYVADAAGRRVVDFRASSLHLVSYSVPVRTRLALDELRGHLHTLPDQPDLIPYRTSYYARDWGFCLSQRQLDALAPGDYDVVVDTSLESGSLTYAECVLPGETSDEIVVSTHVCHPSLATDNLSGIAVAAWLGRLLRDVPRRHTVRLLFVPGTIGSLAWLSEHADVLPRIRHGLVVTGLGGPGGLVYKCTRRGRRPVDRAARHVLENHRSRDVREFSPYGYDERQYNSPGFDLPFGRLSRTPHGEFPEYHTSADNVDFVRPELLAEALGAVLDLLDVLEGNRAYRNLFPYGEPQLGRRGLYPTVGGPGAADDVMAMLWLLSLSDGTVSLLEVAERSGMAFPALRRAADRLLAAGVVAPV